ncbi:hypothetical protein GGH94_002955 [Coemansia aciculifera]|uniref:Peptidase S1 domain-containing protein n=1 Tax=Coemansia aciculifera TaxID=417176 RepID=A0A9W8IPQ3_9FUNG|nr:hypothetical protein GGH94_002955 [Coemansia aciculifera]KAJ2873917.1 hypothetical protein GGH93_002825 [Coemansia aciculifera]KAJ2881040.1 hypothetical protein H4R27_004341 [Coemansia aciculifera]
MKSAITSFTSTVALWAVYAISASAIALPHMEKRIVGGFDLPDNGAPYTVFLTFTKNQASYICGGTVISPNHIVTAAHCVFDSNQQLYTVDEVRVGYGDDSISQQSFVNPSKITAHPGYVTSTVGAHGLNDIAIIEVASFDSAHAPVYVPIYNGAIPAGQQLVALGWGNTVSNNDPKSQPDELKGASVWVGDVEGCKTFAPEYESSDGPLICTLNKYSPGHSTCKGDSGTGVMIAVNNNVYLAGIVSEGGRLNDPTCGTADGYSLFTHVAAQFDFISSATGLGADFFTQGVLTPQPAVGAKVWQMRY